MVFDLETTGLSEQTCRICELGAVRVRALELVDRFQSLVDPGVPLPQPVARLTGLQERDLRGAPPVGTVVAGFLSFAGDAPLVAHNARFDQRFLECQLRRRESRRLAEPPLCTAALARRLLAGRVRRVSLASLVHFFGVATAPCRRALPDAEATAEVLVRLIGLAQELGAAAFPSCAPWLRPASDVCTPSDRFCAARRRGPGCTSSETATSRCSTSAAPATCVHGCVPTSRAKRSALRWRRPCSPSNGSSGASSAPSSRRPSRSSG